MTVDGPLTEAEVRELLAIAHLAPLAVDYDDEAWTAAGCPSDKTTRDARDRFARVAPRLARDLLGAHDELGRVAKACGDFFTGGELASGEVLHGVEAMGRDRDGWQARAQLAERDLPGARERIAGLERELPAAQKQPVILDLMDAMRAGTFLRERDTARAEVARLTRERDEIDATRLGYQAEALAEVSRLRAAMAELGPREDHAHLCGIAGIEDYCTCGIDEHNAKVRAALDVKP